MKRIISLLLIFSMMVTLVACGKETSNGDSGGNELPKDGPEFKFSIATSATSSSIIGQTMQYFADLVEERSGGKITVATYPDAQLGSDTELIEGVQMGTITMVIGNTAPQVSFVPELAVFDLPNVYSDTAQAQAVLNNFKDKMEPYFEGTGLKLGVMFPTVFRYMSSNKPVRSIDDFQGIKIRTMENPYHMAYWNELGASATPLAFSELYVGLQQGLVDAQENPLDIFMSSNFHEQQDYIIHTKHILFIATILMNQEQWDMMPAEYQEIVAECFEEAAKFGTENAKKIEDEIKQDIMDAGVEIIELDESTYEEIVEKVQPVYDMIREAVGSELVDEYLKEIEAAK